MFTGMKRSKYNYPNDYVTNIKKMKCNQQNKDDDDDSDEEEEPPKPSMPDIVAMLNTKKTIYRENNHIYFRTRVTPANMYKLITIIDDYNREHEEFKKNCTTAVILSKPVYLHISTGGGDVATGLMAYDYIKNSVVPIYTIAEGNTISMGSLMFMAGKKRFMTRSSTILIHQISQFYHGTQMKYNDTIDNTSNVSNVMDTLVNIYLENFRFPTKTTSPDNILTREKLLAHMEHDLFWEFDQCIKYGIVDEEYTNYADMDKKDCQRLLTGCNHLHGCRVDHDCNDDHECDESHLHKVDFTKIVSKQKKKIDLNSLNPHVLTLLENIVKNTDGSNVSDHFDKHDEKKPNVHKHKLVKSNTRRSERLKTKI